MESIKRSVEVHAPLGEVYGQWARVEDFPRFLDSVHEVRQIAERQFYWKAEHDGAPYEAVEEISLMIPNRRIAWRNISGLENSGVVTFEPVAPKLTRVCLELAYVPDSGWHDPFALMERIDHTLESFRALIEPREVEQAVA